MKVFYKMEKPNKDFEIFQPSLYNKLVKQTKTFGLIKKHIDPDWFGRNTFSGPCLEFLANMQIYRLEWPKASLQGLLQERVISFLDIIW